MAGGTFIDEQEQSRPEVGTTVKRTYLRTCTRPDVCYAMSVLSRFKTAPREKHWRFVKQLLRHIK